MGARRPLRRSERWLAVRIFFAVPRSAWVDLNMRRSLQDMGHELVRFDFPGWPDDTYPAWTSSGKPRTNERLLKQFRAEHARKPFDLFFGYFYSSVVYPETIDLIRQSGVPTVNFSCNNVHQFDLVRDIAPRFDACIVPEASAQRAFADVGAKPLRIQLAANPRVYRPYPEPRVYDVTFVGQRYADRADFLQHLHCSGVDVRAWGAGWQPRKRLDLAHAKAALALVEDERLDGLARMLVAEAAEVVECVGSRHGRCFKVERAAASTSFSTARSPMWFASSSTRRAFSAWLCSSLRSRCASISAS